MQGRYGGGEVRTVASQETGILCGLSFLSAEDMQVRSKGVNVSVDDDLSSNVSWNWLILGERYSKWMVGCMREIKLNQSINKS